MNNQPGQPDPTEKFLIGFLTNGVRWYLTPFYYAFRSDMGINWSAVMPLIWPVALYGTAINLYTPRMEEVDAGVVKLYVALIILGYIRNTLQARRRRRLRDWSAHRWSPGRSLLEPVLYVICRRLHWHWGDRRFVDRLTRRVLNEDFIYYKAEPVMLFLGAIAIWSIGSILWPYPIFLAGALIFVRNDAQLSLYLKAHEIMDGKKLEGAIRGQLEAPVASVGRRISVAQIPASPAQRPATDDQSVFDRLSPELQMLLTRDSATHS